MSTVLQRYEDIAVGMVYTFDRTITEEDERLFGELTGDTTQLLNEQKKIVHGMLAASFFSTLIDVYGPGSKSLYVSQTLEFRKSLFYGDHVTVRGTVVDKSDAIRVITLTTQILRGDEHIVNGEAKVKILL